MRTSAGSVACMLISHWCRYEANESRTAHTYTQKIWIQTHVKDVNLTNRNESKFLIGCQFENNGEKREGRRQEWRKGDRSLASIKNGKTVFFCGAFRLHAINEWAADWGVKRWLLCSSSLRLHFSAKFAFTWIPSANRKSNGFYFFFFPWKQFHFWGKSFGVCRSNRMMWAFLVICSMPAPSSNAMPAMHQRTFRLLRTCQFGISFPINVFGGAFAAHLSSEIVTVLIVRQLLN